MINVLEMLERSARNNPDAVAFADPDNEITYSALVHQAKQVGTFFLKGGVKDASGIAFFMEKSVAATIVMFGAVYANAFYSFIDVRQPAERARKILETLSPASLITDELHAKDLPEDCSAKIIEIESFLPKTAGLAVDENLLSKARERFYDALPLYVNFTSGSTGVPKGVVVSHRSVIDFIETFVKTFGIGSGDVLANQAPFDFDVSVKDIYSALYTGAKVFLIPREYFSNPTVLMDAISAAETTVLIWAVSAMCFVTIMNALEYKTPEHLRLIMFSGEVMPVKQLNKWKKYLPDAVYVNLYGPTEITCNCTYHILQKDYAVEDVIPIGISFANEKVFLLDEEDKLVTEPGAEGEICVSGTCLALGYYKDPEKTAAVFVQNPLNTAFSETIYKTGDLGKYDEKALLYYCGRKDFQIKHMGQRIELGDIEAAASALGGVDRACCLYDDKHKKIVLFYTGKAEKDSIADALHTKLPPFMMPNKTIRLTTFPLNKNGKIDRRSLAEHLTVHH